MIEFNFTPCEKKQDKFWSFTEIYNFLLSESRNMKELTGTEIISSFNSLNRTYKTQEKDMFIEAKVDKGRGFYLQTKSENAKKHEYDRIKNSLNPF